MNKSVFLEDGVISLRPLTEDDVNSNYARWLNDPVVTMHNSHGRFPAVETALRSYVNSSSASNNSLVLAVIENQANIHVGNISLQQISWIDRSAEIAFLLGEKEFFGKGIMYTAGRLLIGHGFRVLNLHRIYCGTSSANTGMQKLAGKLGFTQEGVRREAIFKNGGYHDIIEYGLLNK